MAARTTVKRGVCSGNLTTRPTRALAGLYLGGSDRFAGLPPGGQGGNRSRTRPPAACCPRPHVTSHLSQQVSLVPDPSSLSLSPPRKVMSSLPEKNIPSVFHLCLSQQVSSDLDLFHLHHHYSHRNWSVTPLSVISFNRRFPPLCDGTVLPFIVLY